MAHLTKTNNPLFPVADRQQFELGPQNIGKSLLEVFESNGLNVHRIEQSSVVQINGQVVLPSDWATTIIKEDDWITCRAVVNGDGGSNWIAIVLEIVLIVVSYGYGAALGGSLGLTGTLAQGVGSAIIMIGGSLLINHFFGPSFPGQNANGASGAPSYTITGTQNQARIGQPMPIVFGSYLMAPDVGANPYVVYEGNDQYLYEIFNFGYSNLNITDLSIGGTPITDFTNVTTQWSTNGALTLFPGNVDVSVGGTLTQQGGPITRTTASNCTAVGIDIEATLFQQNNDGSTSNESVVIYPQYKLTTESTWHDLITPTHPNVPTNGNIYNYGGRDGYGAYQAQNVWTITNDKAQPYVTTYTQNLPAAGQYDIKLTRLTQDIDDTTHYADTTWTQLKSYQPDGTDYTGQTRLAVKIQANNQLNGTITQLQANVSAKCPVYNGSSWSTSETSNPAWWFLWFARGVFDTNGVRILGCGLSDDQIDINGIIEWAGWCDANSLSFNYILGDQMTAFDVLDMIARVGRGIKTWQKGVLGVVYDQEGLPVTQMFGMSNIKAGSFQISYVSDMLAEQVTVQFINPDLQYAQDQVSATVPGVTSPEYTSSVFIPGITSKAQAAQEANLQAAAQALFRRTTQFETDIEGLCCNKGDVIAVSHDLANWSISGRLVSGTVSSVVLDREVTISSSTQPYLTVRHPDGTIETVEVQKTAGTTNTLTLLSHLSQAPNSYAAPNIPADAIYQFDPAATPGRKLKVVGIEPQGNNDNWVKIICRDEIDDYYAAATDPGWIYNLPTLLNTGTATVSNITFAEQLNTNTGQITVTINWQLHQAVGAKLMIQAGSGSFVDKGTIYGQQYTQTFDSPTVLHITVTPVALANAGQVLTPVSATYTIQGYQGPPENVPALIADVTGLVVAGDASTTTFVGQDALFQWRINSTSAPEVGSEPQGGDSGQLNPYFLDFLIQIYNTDGSLRRTDYSGVTNYTYTYINNVADGLGAGPARAFTIKVTARGQQNQLSATSATLAVSNPPPDVPSGISFINGFKSVMFKFDDPSDTDYGGCLIYGSDDESLSAADSPLLLDTKLANNGTLTALADGTPFAGNTTYYFYIAPYDAFGKTGLNVSSQYNATPVTIETIDMGPGSVTATILADAAVITSKIAPNAVDNGALAAAAVATANIQSAAVTNALIASNAVNTVNIDTNAITTSLIASGAVTGPCLALSSVSAANIVSGTVTTTQIASGTITALNIASNTITASQIAANTITASQILAGTITTTQIASNTIVAGDIAANTITSAQIAASTITGSDIAGNTITGSNIAATTITAGNIVSGTITASQIAANTITASQIAANTITASQIAAATITGSQLAVTTITATNIVADTITTNEIHDNAVSNVLASTVGSYSSPTTFTSGSYQTLTTVAFVSSLNPGQIVVTGSLDATVSGSASSFISMRLRRLFNGTYTTLYEGLSDAGVTTYKTYAQIKGSISVVDVPPSATGYAYTYLIDLYGTGGTNYYYNLCTLTAMQILK